MILLTNDIFLIKIALAQITETGFYDHNIFKQSKELLQRLKEREFEGISLPPEKKELHPTEQKYPEQCSMFREIIERMYHTHLDKNADYSPMNILATGIVGIATRLWDKTARILNLMGWNLQTGEFSSERKSTKDESIEDSLLDLAVYAIIALIYRAGKWGK